MWDSLFFAYSVLTGLALFSVAQGYVRGLGSDENTPFGNLGMDGLGSKQIFGVWLAGALFWAMTRTQRTGKEKASIYGLQHGRLHLQVPTAMWMNMGYWAEPPASKTLSEACRDLLKAVLTEAGLSNSQGQTQRRRFLLDLGFGCGDQTVYLMSKEPIRACDKDWWDEREPCASLDHYIGITKDEAQAQFASQRVGELQPNKDSTISLFCADASKPTSWNEELRTSIGQARASSDERWVLALDTAYHFSPSRWPIIKYAHSELEANYMGFDLCLSPTATWIQKTMLRLLTALMGAPWANFSTPQEYHSKLEHVGYKSGAITITDISEHVFTPLAAFLTEQDSRLKTLGLGIGRFGVAKSMFSWWGRTGVMRGVIVVAKR